MTDEDYRDVHRASWDDRAAAHAASTDYAVRHFAGDPEFLSDVAYVEGGLYEAPDLVPAGSFDLVHTGIGALCRLPDIRRWARVVAALLLTYTLRAVRD